MEQKQRKTSQEVQAAWEKEANEWASVSEHPLMAHSRVRKDAIETHLRHFDEELLRSRSILDIGAGGGTHIYFPKEISPRVTAIDLSQAVLDLNPSAVKIWADARDSLPFPDNSFDHVIQFFLNRYLEDNAAEMAEIVRVLSPGGRFIIMDHTYIRHGQEVTQFDPYELQNLPCLSGFNDLSIHELAPVLTSHHGLVEHRGPLYIFTGIKS